MNDATANRSCVQKDDELRRAFEQVMLDVEGEFEAREARALEVANEMVRGWLERELQRIADESADEVLVEDVRYRRHSSGERRYHTLCGAVTVRRDSYRMVGVRNGPTVVPLELAAGILEHATPALAFSVTQGFAERPLRHYESEMEAAHRVVPSRSTLERIGKRIGEQLRVAIPVVEPIVRASERVPLNAASISIGLDRTTVPMAEPADKPPVRRHRPYVREPPAPVSVQFRMAYVGTFAIHDRHGETIESKRFAASADEGPAELLKRLAAEVKHVRAQRPRLPLTIVQDGAPELWNLIDEWLDRHRLKATSQLIDRYHLNERLALVAEAAAGKANVAKQLYQRWMTALDRSDTAIVRICRSLDELMDYGMFGSTDDDPRPTRWDSIALSRPRSREIAGHVEYFRRYRSKIRYATSLRRGLPIGSGVTEGACKSVVTTRFKRSGQRWLNSGLSPCLELRSMHLNRRLRPCFDLVLKARVGTLGAA